MNLRYGPEKKVSLNDLAVEMSRFAVRGQLMELARDIGLLEFAAPDKVEMMLRHYLERYRKNVENKNSTNRSAVLARVGSHPASR